MRDVDLNFTTHFITHVGSDITPTEPAYGCNRSRDPRPDAWARRAMRSIKQSLSAAVRSTCMSARGSRGIASKTTGIPMLALCRSDERLRWHCQLKPPWYALRVGGAAARVGELLCSPSVLPALKPSGAKKRRPRSAKLTMPVMGLRADLLVRRQQRPSDQQVANRVRSKMENSVTSQWQYQVRFDVNDSATAESVRRKLRDPTLAPAGRPPYLHRRRGKHRADAGGVR